MFDIQTAAFACSLALLSAGIRIDISSAMMAMTTRSSMSVKAFAFRLIIFSYSRTSSGRPGCIKGRSLSPPLPFRCRGLADQCLDLPLCRKKKPGGKTRPFGTRHKLHKWLFEATEKTKLA
jgi:hypothetical protein